VELEFLAESKLRECYRVDGAAVEIFENLVNDGQGFQFFIYQGELVFWAENFKCLVRRFSSFTSFDVLGSEYKREAISDRCSRISI
jgi:hypothetical protein